MTNYPINLFIIGPSGCGKSTQAKLIAAKYKLTHFSTGKLFRDQMSQKTPLGLKAKKYIDKGVFCPDKLVLKILYSALSSVGDSNFIVDGTPRSPGQSESIEDYLKTHQQTTTALIHLFVTYQEIQKRRSKMGQNFQDKSRTDNSPIAINKRQQEYERDIKPILRFYEKRNQLIEVDGNRPVDPIFHQDICQKINQLSINKNQ